jgi:hypothetical protein
MRRPAKTTHHKQALAPPRSRARAAAALVGALFLLSVSSASAGTDIQGTPDDLQLKVENASIVEILNALSARFQVMFKARSHNPRVLTGAYSGTLRETLTRVLDGNDYILERSDKGIEITILGASADRQPTPPPRPAVTASATPPPGPAPASAPKPPPAVSTSASVPNINASISSASVPPLSSFAVVPPLTP